MSYKILAAVLLPVLFCDCSNVGKHDPFVKFKANATSLKTETEGIFADVTKLDLAKGKKVRTLDTIKKAAEDQKAASAALALNKAAEAEVKNIRTAIERSEGRTKTPVPVVDSLIEARNQAQAELDAAIEAKEDEKTLDGLIKARDKAQKSLMKKIAELEVALPAAVDAEGKSAVRLKAAVARSMASNNQTVSDLDSLNLGLRGSASQPFAWGMKNGDLPHFLQIKRMQAGVLEATRLFEEYADLLQQLSNPGLIDDARFDKAAGDLNKSAHNILYTQFKIKEAANVQLVSTAAMVSARVYIKNKQAVRLQEFLTKNQATVDEYVALVEDALFRLRGTMDLYYNSEFSIARSGLEDPKLDSDKEQTDAVLAIFQLNDSYTALLERMNTLRKKYDKVSAEHALLAKTIKSPELSLAYVNQVGAEAASASTQFQTAAARNSAQGALLVARRSDAVALKYEREHAEADAETVLAKANYDIAKAAVDADKDNAELAETAKALNEKYILLKARSDTLKAQAVYHRALHAIDKKESDQLEAAAKATP